eukprot:3181849-Prymnesium_polylepis.1
MSGWLHKRGAFNPAFRKRFFCITNWELAWYTDEKSARSGGAPKGTLSLINAAVLAGPGVAASGSQWQPASHVRSEHKGGARKMGAGARASATKARESAWKLQVATGDCMKHSAHTARAPNEKSSEARGPCVGRALGNGT